jgi:pyruvate dehydrogenase (quinone)
MTGLLGWGGAYDAMHDCDVCLLLGTNFPFDEFYPRKPKKVQVDRRASIIGRRTHIDMGLVGDIKDTLTALLPLVAQKQDTSHLERALGTTEKWRKRMGHYVTRGPELNPIRPEYLASTLDELASDDAAFCADTGTPCIWTARYITAKRERHIFTGIRLEEPGDVPDSVTRLLSTPGPALLDAVVDPHALSLPPHITFGEAEGFSLSLAKQALHGNLDEVIETVKRNVRIV